MMLVTGATGNVGAAAVAELLAAGAAVRAFVRDPVRAGERLAPGAAIVTGDFDDRDSIDAAVAGVDALLLSSADGPDKVDHETRLIDAAVAAGVRRIVKVSTMGAEAGSPLPPFDWHGRIEAHLAASGVSAVVLRSCFYMTNLLAAADTVRAASAIIAPASGAKIAMIDPRDTGAVAAAALVSDSYDGRTLELSGPAAITYEDIADAITRLSGRPVRFVGVPDEAARAALTDAGMPPWLVQHLGALFPLLRHGAMAATTDTVRAVTGRSPRTFEMFAADHARVFSV